MNRSCYYLAFRHLACLLAAALAAAFLPPCATAAEAGFAFSLDQPAVTSAGVYDAGGRLVRVLWTTEKTDVGKTSRTWDGKDDAGQPAPAGEYRYKVVVNRAAYKNVGAIGNSGKPPDAAGHTPTHLAAVAVDEEGSVYTANGWDEAGADFKKWDKDGNSVYDAKYAIRNGHPNGAPYAIAVDDQFIYCTVGGWANPPWNEAQQIQRFRRKDGKEEKFTKTGREDGHVQVYEWPSKKIRGSFPEDEVQKMRLPLRAIVVSGDTLFVADFLGNRVLRFDKVTGESKGEFRVNRPAALAANGENLWVGGVLNSVKPYDFDGKPLDGGVIASAPVSALNMAPDGHSLYICDAASGRAQVVDTRDGYRLIQTFGHSAGRGDRAADHFYQLNGIAAGKDGAVVTIQDEPYGGARLARWFPDADGKNGQYKLAWEQFGCEFVSLGNYGVFDPDAFYSMTFHRYKLGDRSAGDWDYTGCVAPFIRRRFYSDIHGVPRVLNWHDQPFYFLPSGDGVQVYRIEDKQMRLAALLGGRSPAPDGGREAEQLGQWTWHDADGKGEPKAEQVTWFKKPGEGKYSCFGMDVDAGGNVIFADTSTHGIREVPVGPPDARGNPTYDWKDAKEVVAPDTSPLKFEPNMAQRADDGSVYAFGWSARWPQPKNNPFWMGGTTLARFDKEGKLHWAVGLPKLCVGLDVIPTAAGGGGGCVAGIGDGARLLHYTADGLLAGSMEPGEAMRKQTGWLDNHASVAVNRDPRDHVLDVFAEDDYTLRIAWYRVDDERVKWVEGKIRLP